MLQKFMDGKKKYSAFIVTVLATLIPLFITEPEAQKTFMDMVPSIAAALAGIFYIITQGGIDKEKEKAKAAQEQAAAVANGAAAGSQNTVAGSAAQPQQPAAQPQQPQETPPVPFDPKAFHEDVLANVEATYTEINPCTIFYKARDKGQVTACQHISQAVDYWHYLVDLAVDGRDWLKAATEEKAGTCGRTPEFYVFSQDFNTTLRAANALGELAASGINWQASLAPFQWKLYTVGALAEQILSNARA